MSTVTKSIEVDVPVDRAYDQWTQFEQFPRFMEGVERVEQLDDTHLHWVAKIAGVEREWDAEIVRQEPGQRIEWRNYDGAGNKGIVRFDPVPDGSNKTKVSLFMELEPESALEGVGDLLGFTNRRIEGDLERFKDFVEESGGTSGGWRGRVEGGEVTKPDSSL